MFSLLFAGVEIPAGHDVEYSTCQLAAAAPSVISASQQSTLVTCQVRVSVRAYIANDREVRALLPRHVVLIRS